MEFFTDRDLGGLIFPGILRAAGLTVHRHVDHFAPDALDVDWVPAVASRGWVILSSDRAMLRNPMERDAIMSSGARFFAVVGSSAPATELAENFVNTLAAIRRVITRQPAPFFAKIYRPSSSEPRRRAGRVEVILTKAGWLALKSAGR